MVLQLRLVYLQLALGKLVDDLIDIFDQNEIIRLNLFGGEPFIYPQIDEVVRYAKNKGLQELIKGMANRSISKVVVLYKDRLTRFGFELIEYIAALYSCEIEVVDNTEKSEQQELVEDLVQIVTVFSCKLQGKRANKAKRIIKELTEND